MAPFIRSDQYNFIKMQTQILINGHASVNDTAVLNALKSLTLEKVLLLFENLTDEQRNLLTPVSHIKERAQAEEFYFQLKPYVIPFKSVTEQTIKKLFPKAKKLKAPSLQEMDMTEISYIGWHDKGTNRKYLVTVLDEKLTGLQGTFSPLSQKGICALCNRHEEVGMFMAEIKGTDLGTFTKRGNYICQNSHKCNQNMTDREKLDDFIVRLKYKG